MCVDRVVVHCVLSQAVGSEAAAGLAFQKNDVVLKARRNEIIAGFVQYVFKL